MFGDKIDVNFINNDGYEQLIEKITKEKLKEFINKAKEYYNVEKERDEEIGRVQSETLDDMLNDR